MWQRADGHQVVVYHQNVHLSSPKKVTILCRIQIQRYELHDFSLPVSFPISFSWTDWPHPNCTCVIQTTTSKRRFICIASEELRRNTADVHCGYLIRNFNLMHIKLVTILILGEGNIWRNRSFVLVTDFYFVGAMNTFLLVWSIWHLSLSMHLILYVTFLSWVGYTTRIMNAQRTQFWGKEGVLSRTQRELLLTFPQSPSARKINLWLLFKSPGSSFYPKGEPRPEKDRENTDFYLVVIHRISSTSFFPCFCQIDRTTWNYPNILQCDDTSRSNWKGVCPSSCVLSSYNSIITNKRDE